MKNVCTHENPMPQRSVNQNIEPKEWEHPEVETLMEVVDAVQYECLNCGFVFWKYKDPKMEIWQSGL